jgi:hypothetical protein
LDGPLDLRESDIAVGLGRVEVRTLTKCWRQSDVGAGRLLGFPIAGAKLVSESDQKHGKFSSSAVEYDNKGQKVPKIGHPGHEHGSRSPGESSTGRDHQRR